MTTQRPLSNTTIRSAERRDLNAIAEILRSADLPIDDVAEWLPEFIVAESDDGIVGTAAMEHHGADGLLRSVAVPQTHRGQGLADRLVKETIDRARGRAVSTLYLLTTTAARYFLRHGFEDVERSVVPDSIRRTRQFSDLCPASAIVMRRVLREER